MYAPESQLCKRGGERGGDEEVPVHEVLPEGRAILLRLRLSLRPRRRRRPRHQRRLRGVGPVGRHQLLHGGRGRRRHALVRHLLVAGRLPQLVLHDGDLAEVLPHGVHHGLDVVARGAVLAQDPDGGAVDLGAPDAREDLEEALDDDGAEAVEL